MQDASYHAEHEMAPAEPSATATPAASPPEIIEFKPTEKSVLAPAKLPPMRIYSSNAVPSPAAKEEDLGDYAPLGRMIRCKLVNTIDSSNISTPVQGLVTDDLLWNGRIIIPKCSEVHGLAQVDKSRERIAAEGAWTFILFDRDDPGRGRELVVKGLALDREDDPEFKALMVGHLVVDPKVRTWGITDGSAGLRGVVIKTNNNDVLNLFVATFLSGIAQSVQGTVTNVFGQSVASPNAYSPTGVAGYLVNPPALGAEAVLDRYAQMVMDSIERDGFFIRVPAGKLFYIYVTEDILTGRATIGGSRRLAQVQNDFINERSLQERVTQPRSERDAASQAAMRNPQQFSPIPPMLTRKLDEAAVQAEKRAQELGDQSRELSVPATPP
jgi:hypothetical protein